MRRQDCYARLAEIRNSYETVLQTVLVVTSLGEQEPELLHANELTLAELRAAKQVLHDVYFVKAFASFEASLRDYWRSTRKTRPITEHLINSIAAKRGVPKDTLDTIQQIREFRNHLVHEETLVTQRFVIVSIEQASPHLNTFLARLPLEWS